MVNMVVDSNLGCCEHQMIKLRIWRKARKVSSTVGAWTLGEWTLAYSGQKRSGVGRAPCFTIELKGKKRAYKRGNNGRQKRKSVSARVFWMKSGRPKPSWS